ncbi:hypothetical protein [Xanthobacter pseudotagetidis]|uniref:hypothetical protein n=1 Tax=Xanthobacter pseudotagetidis TaxID=3119911 RepID=UPI003726F1C1
MTSCCISSVRAAAVLLAGLLAFAAPAQAQPRPTPANVTSVTLPGVGPVNILTYNAAFVSGDPATRRVVLETPNGRRWSVRVPALYADVLSMPVGQNLVIRVLPGEVTALGKAHQGKPGEVLAEEVLDAGLPGWPQDFGVRKVTITTIFVGIDRAAGTVTFEAPDGTVRTMASTNPKVLGDLQQVSPGDLAQITYFEGLTVNAVQ